MANKHYHLYIDDSGNRFPDKKQFEREDGMDHFALGGILFEQTEEADLKEKCLAFCEKWNIRYPLHSTKIRGKRDHFRWLNESVDVYEDFVGELNTLLVTIPVVGFAAVIHRPGYNDRYEEKYGDKRWWMCKTTFSILVERVAKYVMKQGGTFEISFEEVGKKEDRAIIQYVKDLKANGSPFHPDASIKYKALTNEDYKKVLIGEPHRRKKENLSIQIADLYLYPMAKRIYNPDYLPWKILFDNKKVIDAFFSEIEYEELGIKYSCFESIKKQKT